MATFYWLYDATKHVIKAAKLAGIFDSHYVTNALYNTN